jgi:hypothetical protein
LCSIKAIDKPIEAGAVAIRCAPFRWHGDPMLRLFIPAGLDPIGLWGERRLDLVNSALLDLENLTDFKRKGMAQSRGEGGSVGERDRFHRAGVVEKGEGEYQPALAIDDHKPPVANARDHPKETRLELRLAAQAQDRKASARRLVLIDFWVVGRPGAVLDSIAICSERVDALTVVVLQAGEVPIRGSDQFLTGFALGGRNRLKKQRARPADGIEVFCCVSITHHEIFDLGDFPVDYLQAQTENHRVVPLLHGADETDLARFRFGKIKLVRADSVCRAPETLADLELRRVFCELHVWS